MLKKLYVCAYMGYAKERGKLEKLLEKVTGLHAYDDAGLTVITDMFDQYSHTVRILKNKNEELFMVLYQEDLATVKACKKALKESVYGDDQQTIFITYRDALVAAIDKTIQVSKETM